MFHFREENVPFSLKIEKLSQKETNFEKNSSNSLILEKSLEFVKILDFEEKCLHFDKRRENYWPKWPNSR